MNNALLSCRHSFYFNVLPFCTSLISIVAGAVASLELEQCAYKDKDIVTRANSDPEKLHWWPSGSIIAHLHDIIATKYSSCATLCTSTFWTWTWRQTAKYRKETLRTFSMCSRITYHTHPAVAYEMTNDLLRHKCLSSKVGMEKFLASMNSK